MNRLKSMGLGILLILLIGTGLILAEVPQQIYYQGYLTHLDGTPLSGDYSITFGIYDTDAFVTHIWISGPQTVTVTNGVFIYQLGSVVPLPHDLFLTDTVRWLGINVNGQNITPLVRLTASPYTYQALRSDTTDYAKSGNFWEMTGNSGTDPNVNFVGTVDNQAFVMGAYNVDVLRLIPNDTCPNIVANYGASAVGNAITPGVVGAVISGGGSPYYDMSNPNVSNAVTDHYATISGGYCNRAGDSMGTVSSAMAATVGGGAQNIAEETGATVAGGGNNRASGQFSIIPGGYNNVTEGDYSFAAGYMAGAFHRGSFVWADKSEETSFYSTDENQFLIRAGNGVGIGTVPREDAKVHIQAQNNEFGVLVDAENASGSEIGLFANTSAYSSLAKNAYYDNGWHRIDEAKGAFLEEISPSGYVRFYVTEADANPIAWQTAMAFSSDGNVGIGTALPTTKLQVEGTASCHVLQITGGADIAEPFNVTDEMDIRPGMVTAIDPSHPGHLRLASKAYDRCVAGIVSGAGGISPGMLMGQSGSIADGEYPIAMTGRVYCWCDASNGSIQPGDMLTTSDIPGHAMKVTDYSRANGAVIGKAMTSLENGKGLVLVLVTLQ